MDKMEVDEEERGGTGSFLNDVGVPEFFDDCSRHKE
jgi:hypothetical protein